MVGLRLEDPLEDRDELVALLLTLELLGDRLVLDQCLLRHALLTQELGDLEPARRVGRVEGRHLAQQLEGVGLATFLVIAVGGGLQRTDRLGVEAHALVELGQGDIRRIVFGIEIQDLLEDRDGARVEAVLTVLLGDLAVLGDGLLGLAPASIGVAHLEQELRIPGIRLEELLVLLQGLRLGALLRELARSIQYFSLVERQ